MHRSASGSQLADAHPWRAVVRGAAGRWHARRVVMVALLLGLAATSAALVFAGLLVQVG